MCAVSNLRQILCVFNAILLLMLPLCALGESRLPLAPHPKARIVYHSDVDTNDYRLSLGALKKVNNVWIAEQEQRLAGRLHRDTLEISQDYSPDEVFKHYSEQLQNMGARVLFACKARRCGSSNSWANHRFRIKQLYGLDQHQLYAAFEVVGPQKHLYFVALYSVVRGNKRIYAQVDILRSRENQQGVVAANPETIAQALKAQRVYVLPGFSIAAESTRGLASQSQGNIVQDNIVQGSVIKDKVKQDKVYFQLDDQHLRALVSALNKNKRMLVAVVGHDYGMVDTQQQQKVSQAYANYVKEKLIGAGISDSRVKSYGVGGLAPGRKGSRSLRIEIVRINQ